jgi:hypothetical protein
MAKLADAADLKSAGRKAVGVQVPLRAPLFLAIYRHFAVPASPRFFGLARPAAASASPLRGAGWRPVARPQALDRHRTSLPVVAAQGLPRQVRGCTQAAASQRQLRSEGPAADYREPRKFAQLMCTVHRPPWVIYPNRAMGGPAQVLRYLRRYIHRIAIVIENASVSDLAIWL